MSETTIPLIFLIIFILAGPIAAIIETNKESVKDFLEFVFKAIIAIVLTIGAIIAITC